jgi:hypothetical protein
LSKRDPSDAAAVVVALYRVFLKRDPADGEIEYWLAEIKTHGQANAFERFAASPEVKARQAAPSDASAVARAFYGAFLKRDPSEDEIRYWVAEIGTYGYADVFERFAASEETKACLLRSQGLFFPPGHYYSPIVDVEELRRAAPVAEERLAPIDLGSAQMIERWQSFGPLLRECPFPRTRNAGFRFYFDNPSYGFMDAGTLYAMLRTYKPKRYVEVGSGFSSACALDTADRFLPDLSMTFIEPYPDLLLSLMSENDRRRARIIGKPVQQVDLTMFDELEADDFLFIDSTHVAKTGSDVCHELFNVLPRLKRGVFIHFHDIFYPFEYPHAWVFEENRSWNELYILRAFLMHNSAYEFVLFNDYLARAHPEQVERVWPVAMENSGGALWLRKTQEPFAS